IILLFPAYLFALIFEYAALYLLLLSLTGKLFLPELENHSLVAEMCAYAILMPNLIRLDQELKNPLTTLLVHLFVFASIDLKYMTLSSFSTLPSILWRGKTIRFPPAYRLLRDALKYKRLPSFPNTEKKGCTLPSCITAPKDSLKYKRM